MYFILNLFILWKQTVPSKLNTLFKKYLPKECHMLK